MTGGILHFDIRFEIKDWLYVFHLNTNKNEKLKTEKRKNEPIKMKIYLPIQLTITNISATCIYIYN